MIQVSFAAPDIEPKPILFIDEIHLRLGSGSASGSMDAANILKPALARGAIWVIGATTGWNCSGVSMSVADFHVKVGCGGRSGKSPAVIDAPRHPIEKDGALERRFQAVRFATFSPLMKGDRVSPRRAGTGSPSHHLVVGREEIARAVAAQCGIPVGTLTADEGARLMGLEGALGCIPA